MRENILALIKALVDSFPVVEPIVEIGSYQVAGQEVFADLRRFFPGRAYVGCDMREGTGVDRVENVHQLTFSDASVGTVLCADTLEHVANPILALSEMKRVLRADGLILMTSVMDFPIHDYPSDYWRFTPEAFRLLLEGLPYTLVGYEGDPTKPHTVIGLGSKALPEATHVEAFRSRVPEAQWLT